MESSTDIVELSQNNAFCVYNLKTEDVWMSYKRKEVLINLCHKVGYFLLERENEWM